MCETIYMWNKKKKNFVVHLADKIVTSELVNYSLYNHYIVNCLNAKKTAFSHVQKKNIYLLIYIYIYIYIYRSVCTPCMKRHYGIWRCEAGPLA